MGRCCERGAMKLLMHNLLASPVKGAEPNYPLELTCARVEIEEQEFDAEFTVASLRRIDYSVLRAAAQQAGFDVLPEAVPEDVNGNLEFLQQLHHALVNLDVMEDSLKCPSSGRTFPIVEGIPNMLLREDEV